VADMSSPILIWGAGAIGGTLGAYWARAGHEVVFVDVVREHVEAINATGLAIEGPVESFQVRAKALQPEQVSGRFERIVLAVKAHHTEDATKALARHLSDDGYVLSAQNGLNEIVIARLVGEARTMGCFVNFGADWHGPGKIMFGNRGATVVGELGGKTTERVTAMHGLLTIFEPDAVLTDNIWGFLWGKLGYGALLFATALTNASMADCFGSQRHFDLWCRIAREVMAVARARGVRCEGFNGFDPDAFAPGADPARAWKCITTLEAFNRKTAKTHSGVWRDLAVRKRKTEVDAQIGIIAELGRKAGVATPLITRLVELIHDIEDGRRPQSWETLDRLNLAVR
jgi:2-dehydropantoate 2-reductase